MRRYKRATTVTCILLRMRNQKPCPSFGVFAVGKLLPRKRGVSAPQVIKGWGEGCGTAGPQSQRMTGTHWLQANPDCVSTGIIQGCSKAHRVPATAMMRPRRPPRAQLAALLCQVRQPAGQGSSGPARGKDES